MIKISLELPENLRKSCTFDYTSIFVLDFSFIKFLVKKQIQNIRNKAVYTRPTTCSVLDPTLKLLEEPKTIGKGNDEVSQTWKVNLSTSTPVGLIIILVNVFV